MNNNKYVVTKHIIFQIVSEQYSTDMYLANSHEHLAIVQHLQNNMLLLLAHNNATLLKCTDSETIRILNSSEE